VHEAEQDPQGRALSRPVRSEESGYPAALNLEGEVGDGLDLAETLAESVDLDRRDGAIIGEG